MCVCVCVYPQDDEDSASSLHPSEHAELAADLKAHDSESEGEATEEVAKQAEVTKEAQDAAAKQAEDTKKKQDEGDDDDKPLVKGDVQAPNSFFSELRFGAFSFHLQEFSVWGPLGEVGQAVEQRQGADVYHAQPHRPPPHLAC